MNLLLDALLVIVLTNLTERETKVGIVRSGMRVPTKEWIVWGWSSEQEI